VAVDSPHRVWTAVISVPGYSPTSATWSEHDQHDDQRTISFDERGIVISANRVAR